MRAADPSRAWHLAAALTVVAAVALVYREAPSAYFFRDDFDWLAGTLTYHPASLLDLSGRTHFLRPVIELYFWILAPLFSGSPRLFHAASVGLHAANGLLVYLLAFTWTRSPRFAFAASLCFVVLPGYVDAVAWVSALAEPVGALFGLGMLYAFHRSRQPGARRAAWLTLSLASFAASLLTHESSVVFFPLLLIADWATHGAPGPGQRIRTAIRLYGPYALLLVAYLVPDMLVNTRNYLIEEGHYRIGWHAIKNVLDYIVWLYVGKRAWWSYGLIVAALAAIGVWGTPIARAAAAWMILALVPFAFFTWGNTSRYLYLPAIGFALLLAEGLERLDARLGGLAGPRARCVLMALLLSVVAARFGYFATRAVSNFREAAARYASLEARIRAEHPALPPGTAVAIDARTLDEMGPQHVEALVQWAYRDPTLRVEPR